jgi:catechol 2,3-dioxygenase-like lactoylglutathione lyase family enzyme
MEVQMKDGGPDLKLEVVVLPVSDVDRAKGFYEGLGWRLDPDFATAHTEHEQRTGEADADWPAWYAEYMVKEQTGEELPT